ncbi:hypothetical protein J5J83_14530 [Azoarcus sp. L1K30]|uniref:hypothetical protein n=1 Tax=Azoarcus sp. L1K30 TaxID=2820277 RepID=UPI001B833B4E|nr:hypothetical protein [Azoarcus sp. L1K30]MBR0567336.1 hypothetical protein [Azoarcus sp. L1K30]
MEKFKGIGGIVLRLDAATTKENITMQADNGIFIGCPSQLSPTSVGNQTYSPGYVPVPRTVRVIWRDVTAKYKDHCQYEGGAILGDYTVPIADRIPDAVLDEIRNNGGALRIKIRLADDGVLIGWDIERIITKENWRPGMYGVIDYRMAGGDFKERRRDENGNYTGWYIDKNGRKIETDY